MLFNLLQLSLSSTANAQMSVETNINLPAISSTLNKMFSKYSINKTYSAQSIFAGTDWSFFTSPDPTFGTVYYVDRPTALLDGIIQYNTSFDEVYLGSLHDATTGVPHSLRLESNDVYNGGLFIYDVAHSPNMCGAWPALWSVSKQQAGSGVVWPVGGEIDVLEGANGISPNQMTLHASPGCSMPNSIPQAMNSDCNAGNGGDGCGIKSTSDDSFGTAFNNGDGGVYAMEWIDSEQGGIKVWQWNRNSIPADISNSQPDPSKWGVPQASFPFTSGCTPSFFKDHQIIINLTFCGAWAGNTFGKDCPALGKDRSCSAYVSDHTTNLEEAHFRIKSIKVYQTL